METDKLNDLAHKSFGNMFSDGFKLFKKCYWKIILPIALFQIIWFVIQALLLSDFMLLYYIEMNKLNESFESYDYNTTIDYNSIIIFYSYVLLETLFGIIFYILAMSFVSSYIYKTYIEQNQKYIDEIKSAFNPKFLLVILILGLLMGLGLSVFAFYIPGIIIFGFYFFLIFTYNLDDTKNNTLSKTRKIAKGSFWNTIFLSLLYFIIVFLVYILYISILGVIFYIIGFNFDIITWLETKNYGMIIVYGIISNLIFILFAPLFICLLTPLFARSKARYDLGDEYYHPKKQQDYKHYSTQHPYPMQQPDITQQPSPVQTSAWQSRIQEGSGIFCPYCGHKIDNPIKFCPSCGESIEFK